MIENSYLFSSATSNGSKQSETGSTFTIQLSQPLQIPANARNISISVPQASIWNSVPNISSTLANNIFRGTYTDLAGTGTITISTTIADGQYNIHQLETAIKQDIINQGGSTTTSPFSFIADDAQQKVIIKVDSVDTVIDFTYTNNCREILGFDSQILGTYSVLSYITAESVAQFNNINQFLIHSDLVSNGMQTNNTFSNTICQVPITASPGSLINFDPKNVTRISAPEMRGMKKSVLRFWLTNESNNLVDTNSEDWLFRMVISYDE